MKTPRISPCVKWVEAEWPAGSWVNAGAVTKWLRWGVSSQGSGWREGCAWRQVCRSLLAQGPALY